MREPNSGCRYSPKFITVESRIFWLLDNDREITIQQNKNGEEQANLEITAARTVSFPSGTPQYQDSKSTFKQ